MERIIGSLRSAPGETITGQVLRYGIVAGSGYLLAIAFFTVEMAVGVPAYLGLGIAFVLNGLYNFALVRMWAFPPTGRTVASDITRFGVVASLSLLVNYGSFAILYSALDLAATWSQRLAILIAAPVTFFANRLWSFRAHRPTSAYQAGEDRAATSAKNESYSRM